MRATRAPTCCTPHNKSQISDSVGRAVCVESLELVSILAKLGVLTPRNRYSLEVAPAMPDTHEVKER